MAPGLFLIVFPWLCPGSKGTEPPRLGTNCCGLCPPISPHFGVLGTAVASHGTPGHGARGEDTATAFRVLGRRGRVAQREVLAVPSVALPVVTRVGRVSGVSGALAGPFSALVRCPQRSSEALGGSAAWSARSPGGLVPEPGDSPGLSAEPRGSLGGSGGRGSWGCCGVPGVTGSRGGSVAAPGDTGRCRGARRHVGAGAGPVAGPVVGPGPGVSR